MKLFIEGFWRNLIIYTKKYKKYMIYLKPFTEFFFQIPSLLWIFFAVFVNLFRVFRSLFFASFLKTLGWFLHGKRRRKNQKKICKILENSEFFFYHQAFLVAVAFIL